MTSRIAEAYVQIVPSMTGAQSTLENEFSNIGGPVGQSMGQGMMGSLKKLAGPMAAIVGGVAIGTFTKDIIGAAQAEVEQNARINQIATSMGIFGSNVSGVTKRLIDMAQAQALNTGLDEDAIKVSQAKLLTFKELAKTAGEAGGMFDRATMAAMDMAAAGFGTAENNAVQLGKALQDPIHGITALAKSGVSLTDSQKGMIESMVEAGNMAGAQEEVMKALETQFGGTAAATATGADRMAQSFANFQETLGLTVLPMLEGFSNFAAPVLTWLTEAPGALIAVSVALGVMAVAWAAMTLAASPWLAIGAAIAVIIGGIIVLIMNWGTVMNWLGQVFAGAIQGIANVWNGFIGWLMPGINAVGQAFSSVFNGIGQIIGGVFQGIVWAVKTYINTILNLINGVIDGLNGVGSFISKATGGTIGFKLGKIPLLATGGTITGSGTVLVGEKGPELLNLNRGASVVPLDKSGGDQIININSNATDTTAASLEFARAMRFGLESEMGN